MPGISNLIAKLDIPQDDTVEIRLFFLTNADCADVADELLALFPDPNLASQNQGNAKGRSAMTLIAGGGAGSGVADGSTDMSDRLKRQATVNAVPDARTDSVLVTASQQTMSQIEQIINRMDENQSGHTRIYVHTAQHADVLDMLGPLTDLFQQDSGKTSSASTQPNALALRMQTAAQQTSVNASSGLGAGGGGKGGGLSGGATP